MKTPFGPLAAWREPSGRLRVDWRQRIPADAASTALPASFVRRLTAAAKGSLASFADIPTPDGTDFQRRCWIAARRIPRGRTRSYAEIAKAVGRPGAARAVGQAMRRNPIAVIVPCHRVVSSVGLGGYAGTDRLDDPRCRCKAGLIQAERRA